MRNGQANPGPPFAVITAQGIAIIPQGEVSQLLEKSAATQAKNDLSLGPLFRQAAESFRDWSKLAEPGWPFESPEIGFFAIRLASNARRFVFLSEKAQQRMKDEAAQVVALPDPPMEAADTPRIFRP